MDSTGFGQEPNKINKIAIDITRAITPPSLFGIDLELHMRTGSIILAGCVLVLLVGWQE